MFRVSRFTRDLHSNILDGGTWRGAHMRGLLPTVIDSPYKDAFKQFWSTPVPWKKREYGAKPKPGEPVLARQAATAVVVGRNRHIDPKKVENGEDNDYKVLMLFREAKGRYLKDQFTLPALPVDLTDVDEDWSPVLQRVGVKSPPPDVSKRICCMRALFSYANILVLPPEDGGLAEVQGPPGPRKWHVMVSTFPSFFRQMIDILEMPMENALKSLLPFRTIETPATEKFRFSSSSYIIPFDKLPCVKYTQSIIGEQLVWVSPQEALDRYDAGVMDMPTPNLILMHELARCFPKYRGIKETLTTTSPSPVIIPEIVHCPQTNMGTVLLPGDLHHSKTMLVSDSGDASAADAALVTGATPKDLPIQHHLAAVPPRPTAIDGVPVLDSITGMDTATGIVTVNTPSFCRMRFEKDEPWGVRAVFVRRPIEDDDIIEDLRPVPVFTSTTGEEDGEQPAAGSASQAAEAPKMQVIEAPEQYDAQMAEVKRKALDEEKKSFEQTIAELRRANEKERANGGGEGLGPAGPKL